MLPFLSHTLHYHRTFRFPTPILFLSRPIPLPKHTSATSINHSRSLKSSCVVDATAAGDVVVDLTSEADNLATAEDWRRTLTKVVPAVVVLNVTYCRAFDTELRGTGSATGFVVDKARGIILTNRHVVQTGPVMAAATFVNREEVPVYPIYRDPVHDFGFFRYDPTAIKFLSYEEIPLAPEAAYVGLEVRIVGNDSGEKLSILAGTLARLDREAPHYSKEGYNDFNTFYLQAASGTKGGSSGSPVIDWQGRAVALNAGGSRTSSSAFYLPLDRVMRALKFLQSERVSSVNNWETVTIPRGELQATFSHTGFNKTRLLGLRSETEQLVRETSVPGETGMLVVNSVVPNGPAYKHLEAGDVLVQLNGEVITKFLQMETVLDDSVNHKVELQIERGGKPLTLDLTVQDLHSITPDYFLEISGAVIHPLSYQQARNFGFQCGLVYVADTGYMLSRAGVPRHAIINKFAGAEISTLQDLIRVLPKLSKGARVPLEYIHYNDRYRAKTVLVTVDHHDWYGPPQIYTRNDSSGLWTIEPAFPPETPKQSSGLVSLNKDSPSYGMPSSGAAVATSKVEQAHQYVMQETVEYGKVVDSSQPLDDGEFDAGAATTETDGLSGDGVLLNDCEYDGPMEDALEELGEEVRTVRRDFPAGNAQLAEHVVEPTLVRVEVQVPRSCMHDGVKLVMYAGTGVIIHQSPSIGLIVVDRETVPISACDVVLSFAAYPIEIPGQVLFLHPNHNFAIVSYDPSALGRGASAVRAAELLHEPALRSGDSVCLVALNRSLRAISRKSLVINPCAALYIGSARAPRYRPTNIEVIALDTDFGNGVSGVLTDEFGKVQALWGRFSDQAAKDHRFVSGIPVYSISQILDKIISSTYRPSLLESCIKRPMPVVRVLEVELYPTLLSKARNFGLSESWIQALMEKDPIRRHVLRVRGCSAGSRAANVLKQGDMVLSINKEPVTCFRDIERACEDLDKSNDMDGKLLITISREGNEIDLEVGTDIADGNGTMHLVNWCGCIVQDPHPAVRALGFLPEEGHGVYVARVYNGSPANATGLYSRQWVVEVNDKRTPDLDAFIAVTKELKHGNRVRVKTIDLSGKPRVLTPKQDLHYWPTWELRFESETATWRRTIVNSNAP